MSSSSIRIHRAALYEQVWAQPMIAVAKTYGISNVGLAKICTRLRVPVPGRGYWQRLRNGKPVRKLALPRPRAGEPEEHLLARRETPILEPGTTSEFADLAAREKEPANRIVVPDEIREHHSLVVKAEKSLRHAGTDQLNLLKPRAAGRLAIRVSRSSLDRALKIMDALVQALEARALRVSVGSGTDGGTSAHVLGEEVSFWLEEIVNPVERPLTPREGKDKEQHSWRYPRPLYNQVPSGRLALRIGSAPYTGIRRTVADSTGRRLEQNLNKFVEVLVLGAERQQSERIKRERQEREWKEQERHRIEEQERQWKERQRVERLTKQVEDWNRSRLIREYVKDMRTVTQNPGTWNFAGIPLLEWMEWALNYADRLDPIGPIRTSQASATSAEVAQGSPDDARGAQ